MATAFAAEAASSAVTRAARRRWVRRDRPLWPFVWRGLLPLLGLLALGRFALESFSRDDVQAVVRHEVRAALDARGFGWARVDVSGQQVALSGVQPEPGRGDAAVLLARLTTCPSWASRLPCVTEVSGRFTDPPAAAATSPGATTVNPAAASAATPTAAPAGSEAGAPPSQAALTATSPAATAAAPAKSEPGASAAQAAQARAAQAAQAQAACEAELAAIVALSKIEFDPAAASLKPSSAAVLAALAKSATGCPGVIGIEGHTDAIGLPAANQTLSEARAASVRQALIERGIASERLRAAGFGSSRPVADNASADGRAKNRRIEFRIATGNP